MPGLNPDDKPDMTNHRLVLELIRAPRAVPAPSDDQIGVSSEFQHRYARDYL